MAFQKRIVEYLENGKFICAYVSEDDGKRLRLLNQNNRETNLSRARVVHFSQEKYGQDLSREEMTALLHKSAEKRNVLSSGINLQEIWEIASEEKNDAFDVSFLAALFFGENPTDDHCAAFLRAVIHNKLFFKYKTGKIYVHSPEKVEQIRLQQEKEKQKELLLAKNADGLIKLWNDETHVVWEGQEKCLQVLKDYYLFGKEAPEQEYARELLKQADLLGPHDIYELLVKAGIWHKNENISLHRQEIPVHFSDKAIIEAEKVVLPSPEKLLDEGRKDLRDLSILTIDGAATRDFDDGLHIEKKGDNYLVGIHISDVGYFVKPGSALFNETLKRGTSIYFPEGPLTMLPAVLSEGVCSLIKGEVRPALSIMVLLSPSAEVLELDLVSSIISVKRQLTYKEADLLLEKDNDLSLLATLSQLLRRHRVNNGALLLPYPDIIINFRPNAEIDIKRSEADTPSRVLVAEFMILANILGAQFVAEHEAPGLYRSQPAPKKRLIDGFENDLYKVIRQRKMLSPMSLLTKPKHHSGVGAPQYTTVTSPIRRLLDLIMQLQINNIVTGKGILFNKREMQQFGDTILNTTTRANQARNLRHRYWVLKYLESKVGQRLTGLVIDSGPRRTHILLGDFLLDTVMSYNPSMKASPGDTVSVRLSKVDRLANTVKLEW
jgi:exoribonuclease-2